MARKNQTYRVNEDVPARLKSEAARWNISQSDLVNYLLLTGLGDLENGRKRIPTVPGRAQVDFDNA